MRNLVFYADGTWNDDDNVSKLTNVFLLSKLAPSLSDNEISQIVKYQEGVGATGNIVSKLIEGGIGTTLDDKIKEAYLWLAENFKPEDRIFLIGFSRGAYTVRSLVGMMNAAGLANLTQSRLGAHQKLEIVDECFSKYRQRKVKGGALTSVNYHPKPEIEFLGVWDTVGSLGIPDEVKILRRLLRGDSYNFYDTELSANVRCARHALAMDEQRKTFVPTMWTKIPENCDVKQIWFSGVHSNVGGGYPNRDLSDITLIWMIEEARKAGLQIALKPKLNPNSLGKLEDSRRGFFGVLKSRPRCVPNLKDPINHTDLNHTVLERHKHSVREFSPYWPTTNLEVDESFTVEISSEEWWVPTTVFLETGAKYAFKTRGVWRDAKKPHGPSGAAESDVQIGHMLGDFWSLIESKVSGKKGEPSTFSPAKRFPNSPWFALIGIIANGAGENEDTKSTSDHEDFTIGDGTERKIVHGGYLYCCANDAWKFYFNNSGSVTLTISRLE